MQDTVYKSYKYFCTSWCECNVADVIATDALDLFSLYYVQKLSIKKKIIYVKSRRTQ